MSDPNKDLNDAYLSELGNKLSPEQLASIHAAMMEELGIGRVKSLPMENKKGSQGPVDHQRLEKERKANIARTAESKIVKANAGAVSDWNNFEPDDVTLEDQLLDPLDNGQSHRQRISKGSSGRGGSVDVGGMVGPRSKSGQPGANPEIRRVLAHLHGLLPTKRAQSHGPASGSRFTTDQLELARQMSVEFGSGGKKQERKKARGYPNAQPLKQPAKQPEASRSNRANQNSHTLPIPTQRAQRHKEPGSQSATLASPEAFLAAVKRPGGGGLASSKYAVVENEHKEAIAKSTTVNKDSTSKVVESTSEHLFEASCTIERRSTASDIGGTIGKGAVRIILLNKQGNRPAIELRTGNFTVFRSQITKSIRYKQESACIVMHLTSEDGQEARWRLTFSTDYVAETLEQKLRDFIEAAPSEILAVPLLENQVSNAFSKEPEVLEKLISFDDSDDDAPQESQSGYTQDLLALISMEELDATIASIQDDGDLQLLISNVDQKDKNSEDAPKPSENENSKGKGREWLENQFESQGPGISESSRPKISLNGGLAASRYSSAENIVAKKLRQSEVFRSLPEEMSQRFTQGYTQKILARQGKKPSKALSPLKISTLKNPRTFNNRVYPPRAMMNMRRLGVKVNRDLIPAICRSPGPDVVSFGEASTVRPNQRIKPLQHVVKTNESKGILDKVSENAQIEAQDPLPKSAGSGSSGYSTESTMVVPFVMHIPVQQPRLIVQNVLENPKAPLQEQRNEKQLKKAGSGLSASRYATKPPLSISSSVPIIELTATEKLFGYDYATNGKGKQREVLGHVVEPEPAPARKLMGAAPITLGPPESKTHVLNSSSSLFPMLQSDLLQPGNLLKRRDSITSRVSKSSVETVLHVGQSIEVQKSSDKVHQHMRIPSDSTVKSDEYQTASEGESSDEDNNEKRMEMPKRPGAPIEFGSGFRFPSFAGVPVNLPYPVLKLVAEEGATSKVKGRNNSFITRY